ncbi:MAG: hypothetical protein HUU21_38315 [Polyangiaceae bacterium]|nr:hypothetical protein [Polyangiaceae bacterium]
MRGLKSAGRALGAALWAAALTASVAGCGGADEGALLIGGERVDSATIDRDPLALLPSGMIMLGYLDAATLFQSRLGPEVSQLVTGLLPLGPESNFVPSRDVSRVYGGVYAMQGADFCAVLQGTFDTDAIQRAADAKAMTTAGAPLVKSRYGDRDVFVVANIGFVMLTNRTILSGNETGIRRAIDRLRYTKLERSMPKWMTDLVSTKGAAFTVAGDFSKQPAVEAGAQKLPFLAGLRYMRVVGNFQPPGMNFAGALTYKDTQTAAAGAVNLQNLQQLANFMTILSSWGFGPSVPPMQVAQSGNDAAFTMTMDESLVRILLRVAADTARRALYPPK